MFGTDFVVQTEVVGNYPRLHISFQVRARGLDYLSMPVGTPHPMVPIAAMGSPSPTRLTRERTVVEACLRELHNVAGYFVSDFSYFRIK